MSGVVGTTGAVSAAEVSISSSRSSSCSISRSIRSEDWPNCMRFSRASSSLSFSASSVLTTRPASAARTRRFDALVDLHDTAVRKRDLDGCRSSAWRCNLSRKWFSRQRTLTFNPK